MNRYLAFISYRHQERDQKISVLLRKGLENHYVPASEEVPKNRRVFRDTDELPTSSDLGADIVDALRESGWLVALCSEEYIASRWCMREISDFIAMGKKDRILPILVSGTKETAVPAEIQDLPIAADLRNAGENGLKAAVRQILPGLLSVMSGTEESKIAAGERRRKAAGTAAVFAAAVAAILGFSVYANRTANQISGNNKAIAEATEIVQQEEALALEERNNALEKKAAYYAEQAWNAIARGDDELAVEMALEALPEDLHSGEPVSESALNALRVVLNLPSQPKEGYILLHGIDTDFKITGIPAQTTNAAVITGETYSPKEHMIVFESGELDTIESSARAEAAEEGYSRGLLIQNNDKNRIFYGPEKQMKNAISDGVFYTLDGEPFFADHIVQDRSGTKILAWLEEPEDGKTARTAIFRLDSRNPEEEAECELPVSGKLRSASFTQSSSYISIVDEEGILRVFDTETGEEKRLFDGRYSFVRYLSSSDIICAVSEDGEGLLIDTISMETVYTFDCPCRIKQLWYCYSKRNILACCEDGFRIYSEADGSLLTTVLTEEEPNEAVWGGYDEYMNRHTGNTIVVLYDYRAEIYSLNTHPDTKTSDALILYREGLEGECRNAFYSADGKAVFTESGGGDICKWDAKTGELLWENKCYWTVQANSHEFAFLSADGTAVWRALSYSNGVERIDAETGETVYESEMTEITQSLANPVESPDGSTAFAKGQYGSGEMVVFDTASGRELWRTDNPGTSVFTKDGSRICSLKQVYNRKDWTQDLVYRVFDAETGDCLEERILLALDWEKLDPDVSLDENGGFAVAVADDEENPADDTVWLIDIRTGTVTEFSVSREGTLYISYPYSGGAAVSRKEGGTEYIRCLMTDGTMSPEYPADSEEGRRLKTSSSQYAVLNGEEISRTDVKYTNAFSVTRISDGAALIDVQTVSNFSIRGIISPDGENICIYGAKLNPTVIHMSDADTLVEKAKRVKEGQ